MLDLRPEYEAWYWDARVAAWRRRPSDAAAATPLELGCAFYAYETRME